MKQNMKRVLLVLCMVTCLFSLSACSSKANVAVGALDESTASYITQISESLLQQISSFNEADAATAEAGLRKEKQTVLADGLASWLNIMSDTGSMTGIVTSYAEEADDGYACTVVADFENRKVEFKIFYSMEGQNLEPTSISFAPEYTTGERMTKAAMNTLMGMGTVFLVLIFISILIGCFKYINAFEKSMKDKAAASVVVPAPAAAVAAPEVPAVEEELVDDLELVAVITAAIAAATGSSTDGLVVRSIKRAPGAKWKRA